MVSMPVSPHDSSAATPGTPKAHAWDVETLAALVEAHRDALMALPNVVGVGVGACTRPDAPPGALAVVVLVTHKVPLEALAANDSVPRALDGVPVEVRAVGAFSA